MKKRKDGTWLGSKIEKALAEAEANPVFHEYIDSELILKVYKPKKLLKRDQKEVVLFEAPKIRGELTIKLRDKEQLVNDFTELKRICDENAISLIEHMKNAPYEFAKIFCFTTGSGRVIEDKIHPQRFGFDFELNEDEEPAEANENGIQFYHIDGKYLKKTTLDFVDFNLKEEVVSVVH